MPRFIYKAKRNPQETVEGKIDAQDYKDAIIKLREIKLFPLSVEEESQLTKQQKRFFLFKRPISLVDLSTFTRQLSNLLDSGMTITNALDVLIQQTANSFLVQAIKDIKDDVRDGISFSGALSKHPGIFSSLYINMVKSGEVGGMLEEVLSRLADFAEADEQMLSKVRTSLAYPILLTSVGGVTIFILLSFVAPRLVSMFQDLGESLPIPTVILMAISNFFATFWWVVILISVILYTGLNKWIKTPEGKIAFDQFKLKIPFIGHFVRTSEYARLNRTLGTLIRNGVPMIEALDVLSKTMKNEMIREDLVSVRTSVVDGVSLSKSMKQTRNFPPLMINMINVGEESGSLENSLFRVADSFEREVDRMIKVFTTLLEPTLILVLGVVVGFIVISMLLPIFQINLLVR